MFRHLVLIVLLILKVTSEIYEPLRVKKGHNSPLYYYHTNYMNGLCCLMK